ncbi:MAG: Lrp/AsnC ligand binding domain-containing protein [Rhodospirillales bacterium]
MAAKNRDIDSFDRNILRILGTDGRITLTDLAARVGLSTTPCQQRVRRLEKDGYILGYRAVLDLPRMGLAQIAFVQVNLSDTRETSLQDFRNAVAGISEIEQCHMIAGGFDYLIKVRTRDIESFRKVLGEKISALPFVAHTSTFMVMETVRD